MGYKHHTGERLLLYLLQWFFSSENYCCCSFYKIFRSSVVGQLIGSEKLYWCIWGNALSGPVCGAVCWNTSVAIRISVYYKFIFPMILYIIGGGGFNCMHSSSSQSLYASSLAATNTFDFPNTDTSVGMWIPFHKHLTIHQQKLFKSRYFI